MPKIKQLEKCKHPNSRKTKALAKQMKKQSVKDKNKHLGNIKLNILGEKLLWFRDHLNPEWTCCTPNQVHELIQSYIDRFNEELEQIKLKHSIGNRKNRQHASRQDIINLSIKRETEEFNTCGIEIPDLLDVEQFNRLKEWNGELRFLQNFKLRRFSKNILKEENKKLPKTNQTNPPEMDVDS
ncbi:translation machinery-associated protein 16 homolog [Aethina tumida]|uniref:translation machinery-associated protein 16 homolog n=1 Tax=Aethina tumida TaxID=116153 RepID=UPI00096B1BA8|nr:translation machinery-associated protein 16 homolog [Aethina tumida]